MLQFFLLKLTKYRHQCAVNWQAGHCRDSSVSCLEKNLNLWPRNLQSKKNEEAFGKKKKKIAILLLLLFMWVLFLSDFKCTTAHLGLLDAHLAHPWITQEDSTLVCTHWTQNATIDEKKFLSLLKEIAMHASQFDLQESLQKTRQTTGNK